MGNRVQNRIEYYKRLIADRPRHPNLSISEYCRKHGISAWTYYSWRKKIFAEADKEARLPVPAQSFIPVRFDSGPASEHCIEILFPNGITIRSRSPLTTEMITSIARITLA